MRRADVIIVGAGAAGLAAAEILSGQGYSVQILEARNRIGGRIWTLHDRKFPVPVEMGAEFIHGRPEATLELVDRAKLTAIEIPFVFRQRHNGWLSPRQDFAERMKEAMGGLSQLREDMSLAEYFRRHRKGTRFEAARRLAGSFVEGFDAADLERVSAKSIAAEQEELGDVEEEPQFRLLGGYGELMEYLRGSLAKKRTEIQFNTAVREIIWKRSEVRVVCGQRVFESRRVLVTLPLGVMQVAPERPGSVRFSPDISEHRKAAAQLGSGPVVKAVVKFMRAFWEDKAVARAARADEGLRDASFLSDPESAFPTWWTPSPLRLPVLTAWAGGPKGLALSGLGAGGIRKAALKSLSELLGQSPGKLESLIEGFYCHDWPADPWARGAYSYVVAGGMGARARLAKPIQKTLFFAGEATDTSGQASTVAGAIASGKRAAREIMA
jgi:monoamine oxidase